MQQDLYRFTNLRFYTTAPYPCSYLPEKPARSQLISPTEHMDKALFSQLIQNGFRRSGKHIYRPYCEGCGACIPVRIPVSLFQASRSQRRLLRRLASMRAQFKSLTFSEEHYALYRHYQHLRHAHNPLSDDTPEQYRQFILQSPVNSCLIEFRLDDALKILSLVDVLEDGLSAVYTFYDPTEPKLSLGSFSILWQLYWTKYLKLDYLYLGYWIQKCPKMAYKSNFQPMDYFYQHNWQRNYPTDSCLKNTI